ncbi:MAG: hypothetical protein QM820_40265 [Minicystis sp.]
MSGRPIAAHASAASCFKALSSWQVTPSPTFVYVHGSGAGPGPQHVYLAMFHCPSGQPLGSPPRSVSVAPLCAQMSEACCLIAP